MGDTPTYHIPYPDPTDPADVPADIQAHALAVEGVLTGFDADTDATLEDMQDQITGGVGSFVVIADTTLAAPAATVDFAAIPATYAHLLLVSYARGVIAGGATGLAMRYNNDVAANYSWARIRGASPSVVFAEVPGQTFLHVGTIPATDAAAKFLGPSLALIPNYAQTTGHKPNIGFGGTTSSGGAGTYFIEVVNGVWLPATTAAINRLTLFPSGGSFAAGSRFTLYATRGV